MDFKEKALQWAASLDDEHPSERLDFVKAMVGTFSRDEIRRLASFLHNRKRDLKLEEGIIVKSKKKRGTVTEEPDEPLGAAAAVSSAAVSTASKGSLREPWWKAYSKGSIIAFDTEQVTKVVDGRCKQHVATIDVVDEDLKVVYGAKVHHPKGSFKCTPVWKQLTKLNESSFDDLSYPSEAEVREEIKKLFHGKLVISLGGISDYTALGLEMATFDTFDLQQHYWFSKMNEHGVNVRHPHSLRSLAKELLNEEIHQSVTAHTSLDDARTTMRLFKEYTKEKMKDPSTLHERVNRDNPYNDIQVVPNPFKIKK